MKSAPQRLAGHWRDFYDEIVELGNVMAKLMAHISNGARPLGALAQPDPHVTMQAVTDPTQP